LHLLNVGYQSQFLSSLPSSDNLGLSSPRSTKRPDTVGELYI
jgi:hypothetical protein